MSITKLEDVRKEDVATVGGKAANLGELIGMGMPVPDGYVVTEPGFQCSIPAYDMGRFLAVRSSGVAEDGAKASMAGQHDTYLNVRNHARHIREAVDGCFESVNNPRAVAYREENGITEDRIAVIVQRMIDPLYSGVLFTADPVDGDTSRFVVEYVEGTGEKLVSGEVIPFSFDMSRHSIQWEDVGEQEFHTPTLHAYASEIDHHFGCPQDIEWCVDKDYKLWILQARPITTL
jgi:phosphoenolpyruvate synthase/pyruvate phosphate dikinase